MPHRAAVPDVAVGADCAQAGHGVFVKHFYSTKSLAAILGICHRSLNRLLAEARIEPIVIGRSHFFLPKHIEQLKRMRAKAA